MFQIDDQLTLGAAQKPDPRPFGSPPTAALVAVARLSADAILIVREDTEDGTYEIAWNNPAFDRLLGQPNGHLVGHPVFALRARHLSAEPIAPRRRRADSALEELLDVECGQSDISLQRVD